MSEQVIVIIGNDGHAKIEVQGCRGPSCGNLTRDLERALGLVTSDVKTPEFLQAGLVGQSQSARAGQ